MAFPAPLTLPFDLPVNAVITTKVYSGQLDVDPNTGNVEPLETAVQLQCCLNQVSGNYKADFGQVPGLNQNEWWLTGYILSPVPLPIGVKLVGTFPCQFTNSNSGLVQNGEFTFNEVSVPFGVLIQFAGIPITGSFKVSGAN
jgi:hypothetical protein